MKFLFKKNSREWKLYHISRLVICALFMSMAQISSLWACTGIKLTAKDGSVVHGRTLEFGIKIDTSIVVIPREYEFIGKTPQGPGLTYRAKYAALGAIAFNDLAIMDGINEKGLAVGSFYFPGYAEYTVTTPENQSKGLSPVDFSNWILTQFATVEEVKEALSSVFIAPTVFKEWGNATLPLHYIVYDRSGKSLVIEPLNGQLVSYDNPLGLLTNAPTFDWHMTNLRNYINLTPFNVKPLKVAGIVLAPLGQGSGMVGMPGDFTPPSRFVRAAIFSITAIPSENASDAVLQAFHVLNQFDIPVGIARSEDNGVIHTDYTMVTCVRDPQALKFYFKTYEDQNIKVIDLKKFDFNAQKVKRLNVSGVQSIIDISSDLK